MHPLHPRMLGIFRSDYYWSLQQSEWATDVLFRDRAELQARYGTWMRRLTHELSSVDVLRFLGQEDPVSRRRQRED